MSEHTPSKEPETYNPKRPTATQSDKEHYLRPGKGTQTACSCGKSFGFSNDAAQHIEWQIRTQHLIAEETNTAERRGASKAAEVINKELGLEMTTNGDYYINNIRLACLKANKGDKK